MGSSRRAVYRSGFWMRDHERLRSGPRLSVDGVDVTGSAQVTATQVTYTPSEALGGGLHDVTVRVVDFAKNAVESSWSFRVDAEAPEILEPAPSDTSLPADALPVVTKSELMADFDRWVTDRSLTRAGVENFLADRAHIGERYLGRYAIWKSSGTSGEPGIFVQDSAALSTYDAMIAVQLGAARLGGRYTSGVFGKGGKAAHQLGPTGLVEVDD